MRYSSGKTAVLSCVLGLALLALCVAGGVRAEDIPVPSWDEMEWLEDKAAAGDAEAMMYVGLCHMNELVPEADVAKGVDYIRKAAEARVTPAPSGNTPGCLRKGNTFSRTWTRR